MDLSAFIDTIRVTIFEQLVIPGICLIGIFLIISIALLFIKESGRKFIKRIFNNILKRDSFSILPNSGNTNNFQNSNDTHTENQTSATIRDICPLCGEKLVLRTARKGPAAGQQFIGCSAFPNCRYTKNIEKSS